MSLAGLFDGAKSTDDSSGDDEQPLSSRAESMLPNSAAASPLQAAPAAAAPNAACLVEDDVPSDNDDWKRMDAVESGNGAGSGVAARRRPTKKRARVERSDDEDEDDLTEESEEESEDEEDSAESEEEEDSEDEEEMEVVADNRPHNANPPQADVQQPRGAVEPQQQGNNEQFLRGAVPVAPAVGRPASNQLAARLMYTFARNEHDDARAFETAVDRRLESMTAVLSSEVEEFRHSLRQVVEASAPSDALQHAAVEDVDLLCDYRTQTIRVCVHYRRAIGHLIGALESVTRRDGAVGLSSQQIMDARRASNSMQNLLKSVLPDLAQAAADAEQAAGRVRGLELAARNAMANAAAARAAIMDTTETGRESETATSE